MSAPALNGIHHIRIPVSDLDTSRTWYQRVLDATYRPEFNHYAPDGTLTAYILEVPTLPMIELRLAPLTAAGCKGFDPLIFSVPGRSDIEAWIRHLDAEGVEHSPQLRGLLGWTLVFLDPDGLALRVYTEETHEWDHATADLHSPWLYTSRDAQPPTPG
ncbi:VOC family protein [Amycolatopsis pithecellobii]|uniref:VOC family protein n=1 Tax=Amycolatopsis pithecellobii TaxID=664692 RepID=A0A6N7Z0G7_9PSEU|nr:VOC family protein [Amycolatopsis pithecellobii]MTD53251.1 VOC family protein [Amycolatopsis pithecellobii]